MYISVRQYRMTPALSGVIATQLAESLLPLMKEIPGFNAYYVLDTVEGVICTVRIFEDQAGMEKSDKLILEWITRNLGKLLSNISSNVEVASEHGFSSLLPALVGDFRGAVYGNAKEHSFNGESAPPKAGGSQLLTVEEVCEKLKMGRSWVYRRVHSGEIPSVRLGGSLRVRSKDLEEYIENQLYSALRVR